MRAIAMLACLLLAACTSPQPGASSGADPLASAAQLVVVTSADWDDTHGSLRRFEREGDGWREVGAATPVMLGRSGSAWGVGVHPQPTDAMAGPRKREGDGRAPAGIFRVGSAFGYADSATTALPYAAMDAGDWCIDVVDSPLYNRIVNARDVGEAAIAGSSEPMRRDLHADGDVRYRLGFVIEHNQQAHAGAGSCIFAHLWRQPGEATAGCTAMDEAAMQGLLAWLDDARRPLFVLLPRPVYDEQRQAWRLPVL
ncbi:MAG: hypothetical protein KIS72_01420 [Luteimonas sp.]|nr:hypothetical protein [Luteimonas sp.]